MQSTHGSLTKSAGIAAETGKQPHMVRSALYNWPAKIEHWPADLHGSNLYLKTRPYSVLRFVYQ